jgi:hypothetical protein
MSSDMSSKIDRKLGKRTEPSAKKALKEERAIRGAQAMAEYLAACEAERAKTVRLKALREAQMAADNAHQCTTD